MLQELYSKIETYLLETLGTDFILVIMLLTTTASIIYFIVLSYFITLIDKRYFLRAKRIDDGVSTITSRQISIAFALNTAKIIMGLSMLLCGIAMLVLPGQGLVTILIGLSLLPFPGKDKLEQKLLARPSVRSSLNWIRIKSGKEPFIFDEDLKTKT